MSKKSKRPPPASKKTTKSSNPKTLLILRSLITANDTPRRGASPKSSPSIQRPPSPTKPSTSSSRLQTIPRCPLLNSPKNNSTPPAAEKSPPAATWARKPASFQKEGLGSPTSLRTMYRDITGTPREPIKALRGTRRTHTLTPNSNPPSPFSSTPSAAISSQKAPRSPALNSSGSSTRPARSKAFWASFASSNLACASSSGSLPPTASCSPRASPLKYSPSSSSNFWPSAYMNPDRILQTSRILGISGGNRRPNRHLQSNARCPQTGRPPLLPLAPAQRRTRESLHRHSSRNSKTNSKRKKRKERNTRKRRKKNDRSLLRTPQAGAW